MYYHSCNDYVTCLFPPLNLRPFDVFSPVFLQVMAINLRLWSTSIMTATWSSMSVLSPMDQQSCKKVCALIDWNVIVGNCPHYTPCSWDNDIDDVNKNLQYLYDYSFSSTVIVIHNFIFSGLHKLTVLYTAGLLDLEQIHYILVVICSAYQECLLIYNTCNFHWLSDSLWQIRIRWELSKSETYITQSDTRQ